MLKVQFERQNRHYRRTVKYPDGTETLEEHVMLEPGWYMPVRRHGEIPLNRCGLEELTELGEAVAQALLGDRGLEYLEENPLQEHRIVICEDPDLPEISRVPWELAASAGRFLLLHRFIPIVRQPRTVKTRETLTVHQPPGVLLLSASPSGQASPLLENRLTTLALTLGELTAHGYITVDEELNCTREKLNRLLCDNYYDIVCFTGDGYFDETKNTGGLVLETPDGAPEPVSANDLVFYFRRQKELPLVLLNCINDGNEDGRETGGLRGFVEVARRLQARGVPEQVVTEAAAYESHGGILLRTLFEELAMDPGFNVAKALTTARCAVETTPEQLHDFYRCLHYSALERDAEITVEELGDKQAKEARERFYRDLEKRTEPGNTERAILLNRGGAFRRLPEELQYDLFRAAGAHPFIINIVVDYLQATPRLPETVTGEEIVLESIRRILPQLSPEQLRKLEAVHPTLNIKKYP